MSLADIWVFVVSCSVSQLLIINCLGTAKSAKFTAEFAKKKPNTRPVASWQELRIKNYELRILRSRRGLSTLLTFNYDLYKRLELSPRIAVSIDISVKSSIFDENHTAGMNNNINIDVNKIVKHWVDTSDDDFKTMLGLFNSKSYAWSLFLGHISVEKLLKALYVKKFEKHAPFTHNLYRLAELLDLKMENEYADWLDHITSFNLNARYDDYKREFYTLCTPEYTMDWIEKIKVIRIWIKEML